jgi:exopolysaccharide biosynthesis polyprenyl glycosylphosphotransferase
MTTLVHAEKQLRAALPGHAAGTTSARARRRTGFPVGLLIAGDVVALAAAVLIAGAPLWALALVPAALTALTTRGHYRPRAAGALDGFGGVLAAVTTGAGALLLAATVLAPASASAPALAHAWLLAMVLVAAHRVAVAIVRRSRTGTPVAIIGGAESAAGLKRLLSAGGMRAVAHIDVELAGRRRPADTRDLARMAREAGAAEVVIVPGRASDTTVADLARSCADAGLGVAVRSAVGDAGAALTVEQVGPVPLVRLHHVDPRNPRLAVKHGFDRLVAAILLLSVAPLFGAIALAVKLSAGGPVLFRQRRVGRDGREFDMLKFRSMRGEARGSVALAAGSAPGGVEGDDRRTAVGTLIRRTSLDELPQLLNVLRGEMSLVGPRPERPEFVDRFTKDVDRYAERHPLKSCMTGLAQVNGLRGRTSIADRVAFDNHYVEHWSLSLDAKVLLRTVRALFQPAE